ncbi:NUDIX hydrolase [Thiothrix subterranea]|uniref:NUDIX hydrolase n=1 Tax=Thiothrix subterranea TaxID=2735563 RepID=UPI00280C0050|nr:CoA pyrophosphatase [Thiothrix subterranea]
MREAHEEIGILPHDVAILGQLSPHHSVSRFQIVPTVAHVPWPYELILSPQEVARAFTIPLHWLAQPQHHEIRYRQLTDVTEPIPIVYFQEYDGEILWGRRLESRCHCWLACNRYLERYAHSKNTRRERRRRREIPQCPCAVGACK